MTSGELLQHGKMSLGSTCRAQRGQGVDPPPPQAGVSSGLHRGKAPRREEALTGFSRVCGFISSQKDAAKNSSLSLDDFTLSLLNLHVASYYLLPAPAGLV